MYRLRLRVRGHGPIFDGRARVVFRQFSDELEEEGAEWALDDIKDTFHKSFKNPTGYYESHVDVRRTPEGYQVDDGGLSGPVYGPWLEGVGSRNAPRTRFKGYGAFRKAAQRLERRLADMGDRMFNTNYRHRL